MTPKEKADELFLSFCKQIGCNCEHEPYCSEPDCNLNGIVFCKVDKSTAKQCAFIAVDEIVSELIIEWGCPYVYEESYANIWAEARMQFWEEVKKELSNL
jgi:hypothetical protein